MKIAPWLRLAAESALHLLAPTRCAACDGRVAMRTVFCAGCAASLEPPRAARSEDPPCAAAFAYGGAVAQAIVRFKYARRPDLARPLAALLRRAREDLGSFDLACPVPLHAARLAERGYNQAALVGAPLARDLGARWAPRALARIRDTARQASLDRVARSRNVEGAFVVRRAREVAGARVLLVDDVRTTGATLAACARALREAGARDVACAVIARADDARSPS